MYATAFTRALAETGMVIVMVLGFLGPVGCREEEPEAGPAATKQAADPAAIQAKLAMADKVDGKEDKIVGKCASCLLAMDGKQEFAFVFKGFTLYFCSAHCKDAFAAEPEAKTLAMKKPE